MGITRMPAGVFVEGLIEAQKRGDGYIMGATGQDPKKWSKTSWWFSQYKDNPKQYEKALYWREHAARVWDCNGLAEGLYKDFSGVDVNTKCRYSYANWCGVKGKGIIPSDMRVPGAAVYWGESAAKITHVAYLVQPVDPERPEGDWWLVEARGVTYGVVKTKLLTRKPQFWGLMDKYFDYGEAPAERKLGDRVLKRGDEGSDVKELQEDLIRLSISCGKCGADGIFGEATELAVEAFQTLFGLEVDSIVGEKTVEAIRQALADIPPAVQTVRIVGGNCWIRTEPNKSGEKIGVAKNGERYVFGGEISDKGWHLIALEGGRFGWVSGKYSVRE